MNYYAVKTMAGHVGKGKYYEVTFPVYAENGREAAEKARWIPRVKHHNKYCILEVKKITIEEYNELVEYNKKNPYLLCSSNQELRRVMPDIGKDIKNNKSYKNYSIKRKKENLEYRLKKSELIDSEKNKHFKYHLNKLLFSREEYLWMKERLL